MSELRADTITASDGTSPVTLTKQSAAKAWVNFNGTGTAAINESFGTTSLTDNAQGRWHINLSNAFTNRNFPQTVSSTAKTFNTAIDDGNKTSTQASLSARNDAGTWVDTDGCVIDCLGDLAT